MTSIPALVRTCLTPPLIKPFVSKEQGEMPVSRAAPPALLRKKKKKKGEISGRNWLPTAKATSTPAHRSPTPMGHGTAPARAPTNAAHAPTGSKYPKSELKTRSFWRSTSKIQSNPLILPQRCLPSTHHPRVPVSGLLAVAHPPISKTRGNWQSATGILQAWCPTAPPVISLPVYIQGAFLL